MKKYFYVLIIFFVFVLSGFAQKETRVLYKQIDTTRLYMNVYSPENLNPDISYPAIVFFFGGGWNGGSVKQFEKHAKYFANRGMVSFLADYRVKGRQQTSPFESLKDAKTAIRFIRENAKEYHVDINKVVASGGSAGGHLAAATALIENYNEKSDDLSLSCIPNALVLFNPVIDNGPGGYGYDRIGENYKSFSPLHNIMKGASPTIIFLGTEDHLIPVETMEYYKTVMEKVGSRCDLFLYEGEGHGFFNASKKKNYESTISEADKFLTSLGYLSELE
ncbi:MAG: alpha/beta hydrolase [Draconibacterium sp.]|nr:alpha/beta hydrolase [Draconibacterium sp.]